MRPLPQFGVLLDAFSVTPRFKEQPMSLIRTARIPSAWLQVVVACALTATISSCTPQPMDRTAFAAGEHPSVSSEFLNGLEWRFIGPMRGGRAPAVAGDPDNPLVFYHGTGHGGVWKTTDAGLSWRNVSDGYVDVAPIGAMDVAPSNPRVLFVGTGEGIPRQHITAGRGVFKSTDAGETWTHVGLAETLHISDLVIHPQNPDIVYVAAKGDMFGPDQNRGVYRTRDGGGTWQKVLYKNDLAGAVDLSLDPSNPNVVYASLNHHVRYPWDEVGGGEGSGLYKTTDGGDSWVDLTRNPGMPAGVIGKIGVSVSPARSNRIYTIVEAAAGGVYRSDDGGATWRMMSDDRTQRLFPASYNHIVADTRDPDLVYLLHQAFWKSTDGGVTFSTRPMHHADHHALWIDPNDSRRMIDGGDGGASVTLNGGLTWSGLNNQSTADLFSLAIDDQEPYWLYVTQNDNSHVGLPSQTTAASITAQHYLAIPQGEGGQTSVKPDGSVVYAGDRTSIVRFDRGTGQGKDISVWPEDEFGEPIADVQERFYYNFPVYLSPNDPGVLYTGSQYLYRSTDEGMSWERISPDLSKNRQDVMGKIPGGPITSIASSLYYVSLIRTIEESPRDKNELWIGTDDSTVQLTTNGGRSWQDVSPPDLPEWTTITAIDASAHHAGTAYLTGGRHRVSDRTPYLYKTTDYGETWERITNGIRENDFTYVIREDPVRPGLLYAGSETGAYISFDDGASWQSLQRNLPPVAVMFMQVKDDDLVIATHGRGAWILDNVTALRQLTSEIAAAPTHLFEVAPATRDLASRLGPARQMSDAGTNPPSGVVIDYYLAEQPTGDVVLTILDPSGEEILTFSSGETGRYALPARAGMNRFLWDMRYPDPPPALLTANLTGFEATSPSGPVAVPGRYNARLTVDGESHAQSFEIRKAPYVTATDQDLRAQFQLVADISQRAADAADALNTIRDMREELERAELSAEQVADLDARIAAIEGQLQRQVGAHAMELMPKGLYNRLGTLSRRVLSAESRPTQQEYAVFDSLSVRIDEQLRQLDALIRGDARVLTSTGAVR
jgi:photosystem II stability/assembly factor-like uncharacterized protein